MMREVSRSLEQCGDIDTDTCQRQQTDRSKDAEASADACRNGEAAIPFPICHFTQGAILRIGNQNKMIPERVPCHSLDPLPCDQELAGRFHSGTRLADHEETCPDRVTERQAGSKAIGVDIVENKQPRQTIAFTFALQVVSRTEGVEDRRSAEGGPTDAEHDQVIEIVLNLPGKGQNFCNGFSLVRQIIKGQLTGIATQLDLPVILFCLRSQLAQLCISDTIFR